MKKITRILIAAIIIGVLGFGVWYVRPTSPAKTTWTASNAASPIVTFVLNATTYSNIQASSPYEALVSVAQKNNIPLQTKQYDFGVFVEGIGDQKNTTEKAWIYYVNGKSGSVASDKYLLKQNDTVEWKYTTPIY